MPVVFSPGEPETRPLEPDSIVYTTAQKVADLDPMEAAMSSLNASAERNRKADEEMRRRTADKASGQQSTTAVFGQ